MESAWPSMPSFKKDTLWPDFLKTHLRGDSPMDTTLSIKVPGTVVPYVIHLASKNCIILRAGLSITIPNNQWFHVYIGPTLMIV